jgi:hypothetical protein
LEAKLSFELGPSLLGRFTTPVAFAGTEGIATFNMPPDYVQVEGKAIPRKILFQTGGGPRPWLRMGIEVRHDRPECAYLEIEATESTDVRSKDLKLIRIEGWITHIVAACTERAERISDTEMKYIFGPTAPDKVKTVERMQRRRRNPNDRELLEQVAALYKANPQAPLAAISEELGMSSRTAARWAARCSDIGLLPSVDTKGKKRL